MAQPDPPDPSDAVCLSDSLAFLASDSSRRQMYEYLGRWFQSDGELLDVGCGAGALLEFAAARGMRASGIDLDPSNVSHARALGYDVFEGDALNPPSELGRAFDVITMVHVVEHFSPSDVATLMSQYATRLRPGGRLVLVTPNYADWTVASEIFWLDPTHVRPYPAQLLARLLGQVQVHVTHVATERLVELGRRSTIMRPLQRLRFGRQYERMNLVVVGERLA